MFAGREIGEGHDIESLSLPGDQNQMIEAVAAANPRTVVVADGRPGGDAVAAPGGRRARDVGAGRDVRHRRRLAAVRRQRSVWATADHLPGERLTGPGATAAEYPGITNLQTGASDDYDQLEQEDYNEGIDVGYRWYETHGQQPLFPFGFGLSYTTFARRIVGRWPDGTAMYS